MSDDRKRILDLARHLGDPANADAARGFALGAAPPDDGVIAAADHAKKTSALARDALIEAALAADHEAIAEVGRRNMRRDVLRAAEHRDAVARAVGIARTGSPDEAAAALADVPGHVQGQAWAQLADVDRERAVRAAQQAAVDRDRQEAQQRHAENMATYRARMRAFGFSDEEI